MWHSLKMPGQINVQEPCEGTMVNYEYLQALNIYRLCSNSTKIKRNYYQIINPKTTENIVKVIITIAKLGS
ncbi:MAG: hypothetical protein ACJAYR_001077 [Sneathiella sp.]|jgi:hypothetical protein